MYSLLCKIIDEWDSNFYGWKLTVTNFTHHLDPLFLFPLQTPTPHFFISLFLLSNSCNKKVAFFMMLCHTSLQFGYNIKKEKERERKREREKEAETGRKTKKETQRETKRERNRLGRKASIRTQSVIFCH